MRNDKSLRGVIRFLAATLMLAVIFMSIPAGASAQNAQLTGRLGGTLDEMQTRFGAPSWTDTGLIGYNSQTLAGVDSIVVVYYDARNVVSKISLVYLTKPAQFSDPAAVAATVAQVAPMDGTCGTTKLGLTNFGSEVYSCQSGTLAGPFDAAAMTALGVKGAAGEYSYSIDPTVDQYFEVIIQPGTDTNAPPPTAVPTAAPQPTAAPSLNDTYPPVADVRELAIGRGYSEGDQLSISGTVFTIQVTDGLTIMQIYVGAPDGSSEPIVVGYRGDTAGIFEGTWITAYGTYRGPLCFTNVLGGDVCQPSILAETLEH